MFSEKFDQFVPKFLGNPVFSIIYQFSLLASLFFIFIGGPFFVGASFFVVLFVLVILSLLNPRYEYRYAVGCFWFFSSLAIFIFGDINRVFVFLFCTLPFLLFFSLKYCVHDADMRRFFISITVFLLIYFIFKIGGVYAISRSLEIEIRNVFVLKSYLGSQRTPFVSIALVSIVLPFIYRKNKFAATLIVALLTLVVCVSLSRSSIVALGMFWVGFLLLILNVKFNFLGFLVVCLLVLICLVGVGLLSELIDYSMPVDPATSMGQRLWLWHAYFQSDASLWVGSGFKGASSVLGQSNVSWHSQYLDSLARGGVLFLGAQLALIGYLIQFWLLRSNWINVFSVIGLSLVGVFHETFTLPHGNLILCLWVLQWHEQVSYESDVFFD